ncbi:galactofuranosylgalactofuranosylrhamnosyl-N-acetylglucosaminyl-diphospho-decaprenol beta-1,5/1,6-galactofuranosyltransferase [Pseudonocardia thermophila]|uniref:Galactofuranosylgalactofuranosylrhamnosyl-N-acetylglucosaminyl-diphospho-decaprenol beta-1,5/1,6-galactofuranosyltransferase n=1 Tax=Pseudonocardia thermophila TaxID=1848 RepID=A0A1M6SPX0_PSETH|nr:glycosyltransferase [Pseudonocardia thermophila]SHK46773.1 galactofuranosylgalactofuranosylrhamnosyl-N-acetylglucosaminyl-diphospho-decaprenol beta-1,5/1,6-galactofuranosyltransferase [Pseudonocardia thermophila]
MLRTPDDTETLADRAAEPRGQDAPGRLLVQRGLFFGPSALVPEDLYSKVECGAARRTRRTVELSPATRVTTNTYFGRFHATYWQRWTAIPEVEASATVTGTGRVRLYASDTNKVWRIVDAQDVENADGWVVRLVGKIDRFVDGGGMWLEFTTERGELTVTDVRWSVAAPRTPAPTVVGICTFNRVEDCLNTMQALADDPEALTTVEHVQVVDQGTDPLESRTRFAEVSAALGGKLRYVRQPNLGGAGGFTRTIFDATRGPAEEHRDVLLMDDDVLLEPEILVRLTAFAACTTHPTIVGGQMLNLLHPAYLHIAAEYADIETLRAGLPIPGALKEANLLGTDKQGRPIVQERRVDTAYNGWWACLIPAEIVRRIGYPLPMFFQWDDVEYGYRARAHGIPTVALPGAAVWHADFGWKDWDEWHRYFNMRNALITAALHTPFTGHRTVKELATLLGHYLVAMHYGLAATLIKAVEDFLEGPKSMNDGSVAAAAEIRKIRSAYPETVTHAMAELPEHTRDFRDTEVVRDRGTPGMPRATWAKRVAYQLAGIGRDSAFVPAGDAHWWHVSLFKRAIVTDMSEMGFRVRERDAAKTKDLAARGLKALKRLYKEGPAVAQRYREAAGELMSRGNWARLYGLDD